MRDVKSETRVVETPGYEAWKNAKAAQDAEHAARVKAAAKESKAANKKRS